MRSEGAVPERNSFGTAGTSTVGQDTYAVHRLAGIAPAGLPVSLRIVLENLLRHEDGVAVPTGHSGRGRTPRRSASPEGDL